MRMHPLNVPQQCLGEVLLGPRLAAADALQPQADRLVSHFHGACVDTAGHARRPDRVGRRPPVDGAPLLAHYGLGGCVSAVSRMCRTRSASVSRAMAIPSLSALT